MEYKGKEVTMRVIELIPLVMAFKKRANRRRQRANRRRNRR